MRETNHQRLLDLFLVSTLLLTVFPVSYSIIWLVPQVVLLESMLWLFVAIISIWVLKRHRFLPVFVDTLRRNWFIFPFLIFSGLSIFWSVYWEVSLLRWFVLLCTIIVGGYIGLEYNLKSIVQKLAGFGLCILVLSAILIFFMPKIGVMNYHIIQGAWKGIFWHKNHMGLMTTFINILFLVILVDSLSSKGKDRFVWLALYLLSLLFLFQTDSVASYLTTLFLNGLVFIIFFLLKFRHKIRKSHYLVLIAVLLLASIVLSTHLDDFLGIFNRNTSLTGRIPMWSYLFKTYINQRPLSGYGFNAFWYIDSHRVALQKAAGYPDPIVISDNGFIDILVNTGYLGLILFLIFYIGTWWASVKYAIKAVDMIGFFPLILMCYTLLANISWSLMFENENFFMLIMFSVLFCITARPLIGHEG